MTNKKSVLRRSDMYKEGDKVQFIEHENLDNLSGKIGTIIRRMNDDEVEINDDVFNSKYVYEVYVPLHPTIQVLEEFIRKIG